MGRGRLRHGGVVAVTCALAAPGAAAQVTQDDVVSAAPDARVVRVSHVRIHDPLPESAGAHPEECDWIGYLRFRHAEGPRRAARADAIVTLMPGFLGGAGSFDQVARNTVRGAGMRGYHVEVWGLDRRANCLEDHVGVKAAAGARDASVAYGYYWGGQEVDGKRFGGFRSASDEDVAFLDEVGLERTVRDWYTVLERSIPSQATRVKKVVCGGHSLGGPLTAAFAGWDFDGDPETDADAGYNQCAGLVGLDTSLSVDGSSPGAPGSGAALDAVAGSGAAPFVDAPPLTPETIQVPSIFGVGSFYRPEDTDLLRELPHSTDLDLTQRLLYSRDTVNFVTGTPSIRDFTLTNEATLAGVFDDNSNGISILRSSLGFATGGPVADKNFPAPDGTLAIPSETSTPLYSWQSYDQVGLGGAPLTLNESGEPYTSRESEVADLREFSRGLFEAPLDFVEQYFPTKVLTDTVAAGGGARDGSLGDLRYDGVAKRPGLLIQAGDSEANGGEDSGPPVQGTAPNADPLSREVILPGYNHLDVATAAWRQNDGRPEPSSAALTDFVLRVVRPPQPAIRLAVRPRRVSAGQRVRLRFRIRSKTSVCRRGVAVRLGGRRVRTGRRGRASLKLRPRRAGRRRVTARKVGCRPGAARLRVMRGVR